MFDIGFSELLLIAVVALVVLGPERLPKAARFAGLWVRRARAQWDSVKQELERELHADELKRTLHDVRGSLHETEQQFRAGQQQLRQHGDALQAQIRNELSSDESLLPEGPRPVTPADTAGNEAGGGDTTIDALPEAAGNTTGERR